MDQRKLKRIKKIAQATRTEIKRMARLVTNDGDYFIDKYNLCGACGIASYLLHEVLRARGFASRLVYGTFEGGCHFWVVVDNTIVDITHTQFSEDVPPVTLFPKYHGGFCPEVWTTREAKKELFDWDSYKEYVDHLDSAKKRLLKRFRHGNVH